MRPFSFRPLGFSSQRQRLSFRAIILLLTVLSLTACNRENSAYTKIDLNEQPARVAPGLVDPQATDNPGWVRIPAANPDQQRPLRLHSLGLPGIPERKPVQWWDRPMEDFSVEICFSVDQKQLEKLTSPALHLAHIGEKWAIHLNGTKLMSNLEAPESRSRRNLIFPLDVRLFQEGSNCLLFHIRGDPVNMETGLYYGGPYRIIEYQAIVEDKSEAIKLSLISIYLAIGLFHTLFFLQKKRDRYNVYFGLFSGIMALWLFSRSSLIYSVIPQYPITLRLELLALFLLLPSFASFVQSAQGGVHVWFMRTLWISHGLFLLLLLWPSVNLLQDLITWWRVLAILFLFYFLIIIPMRFWRYVRLFQLRYQTLESMKKAILNTVPGNLLIGTVVVVLAGIFDIVNASQGRGNQGIIEYVFLIFVGGSALRIANRLYFLNDMVENLNRKLRHNLSVLNETNTRLRTSERRYRHLIDGSRDIILSLDSRGTILLASRACRVELGIGPEDLEGKNIESLIHGDPADQFRTLEFFRERFEVFRKEKENLQMKIPVRTRSESQPAQFQLTLQKMQGDEHWEILGRLMPLKEDYLLQFLEQEQLTFSMGNELIAVEELSQRLVRNLPRYIDASQAGMIRIGLREILINAIEHGNLAISFEEKSRELSTGNYSDFIILRQSDPRYRDRRVTVDYNLDSNGVVYRIQDQGKGFDHHSMSGKLSVSPSEELPLHGRGIMITRNAFDLVEYNEKGNEVRLLKYFR
tara:strand:- start:96099 stop:98351 length:2253 start_codon:yes stop_codon:yes gene_type:complete